MLSSQQTIDAVTNQIANVKSLLSFQLRDACPNLREEDIGATGTVVFREDKSTVPGESFDSFMVVPTEGDYEFVPVLVNPSGQCEAGKTTLELRAKFVDFSDVHNTDDLSSVLENDPDIASLANK